MTPQEFRDIVYSFQTSRIILTSIELQLYNALEPEARTSEETSKILLTDARATDRLMNVLCSLNLLEKKDGKFSNSAFSSRYLVKGKRDYISNMLHAINLWESWSGLTDAVKNGRPAEKFYETRKFDWLENLIEAMHYRGMKQADEDIGKIDLSGVNSVLDLGGGSGAFSIGFANAKNDLNAVVFDLPNVTALTEKYIAEAGLSHRIKTLSGNYLLDDIGNGYDLIFLSAVVHSNSFEENKHLIKKCAAALNLNGRIVIQDYVMDEDRTNPPGGAFFALNMLVNTYGGDTYTEKEITSWLTDAGLENILKKETSYGVEQISGQKIQHE